MRVTAKWTVAGLTRGKKYQVVGMYAQFVRVVLYNGSRQYRHKGAFEETENL